MNLAIAAFLKPFAVVAFLAFCLAIRIALAKWLPDNRIKHFILKERRFPSLSALFRKSRAEDSARSADSFKKLR